MGPAAPPPAIFSTLPARAVWAIRAAFVMRMWTSVSFPHRVVMAPLVATQMAHTTVFAQRATRVETVSSIPMIVLRVSTGPFAEVMSAVFIHTVEKFHYGGMTEQFSKNNSKGQTCKIENCCAYKGPYPIIT